MISKTENKRYYGIDILKITAMLFVIILHILGNGGVLNTVRIGTSQFAVGWFLNIAAYCAVNCFAMATGFLMVNHKFKYRKIVNLWLIVVFYNVLMLGVQAVVFDVPLSLRSFLIFLPISGGGYWYFTAYVCVFFFIPFLNKLIDALTKEKFCILLLTGFFLFSVSSLFFIQDSFLLADGYSTWWLMYVYLVGAGIRKYHFFEKMRCRTALLGYFVMILLSWLSKYVLSLLGVADLGIISKVLNAYVSERLILYLSPTNLLSAVFLLLFCIKLKISKPVGTALSRIQPLVFQVYIIHYHQAIVKHLITDRFTEFARLNPLLLILAVIGTAAAVFLACLMLDWLRSMLFRLLCVDRFVDHLAQRIAGGFRNSWLGNKFRSFTAANEEAELG